MRRYCAFLEGSAHYRAYLRHNVWTWDMAPRVPFLAIFPFGVFFGTWWVLVPSVFSVPIWVTVGVTAPDFFAGGLYLGVILAIVTLLPLILSVALNIFRGHFARVALMLGKPDRAKSLREKAAITLRDCEAIHD